MHNPKRDIDYFGDDFEVTYTGELPEVSLDFDDTDYYEEEEYEEPVRRRKRKRCASQKHSSQNQEDLASPLRAPIQKSTRLIERVVSLVLRLAPVLMGAGILLLTIFVFWTEHSVYGEPESIMAEQNFTLAVYLIVGVVILLWEICSFFFILGGVWSKTGRGITFFILIYVLSYLSSFAGKFIPEGLAVIDGLRGGMVTYGSLYTRLFTLCLLGIIACILQKIRK